MEPATREYTLNHYLDQVRYLRGRIADLQFKLDEFGGVEDASEFLEDAIQSLGNAENCVEAERDGVE